MLTRSQSGLGIRLAMPDKAKAPSFPDEALNFADCVFKSYT
jgi:hypothetical protein